MKKLTKFIITLSLLLNILVIVPSVNAEQNDYSNFIGMWYGFGDGIEIINIQDDKMDLIIHNGFDKHFDDIPIVNNQAEITVKTSSYNVAYDDYYKFTFSDNIIHLLYSYPYRGTGEMLYYNYSLTNIAEIKIGDYLQMGTYYDEPILWRCVTFEKIIGYDKNGNPIMDSTDTTTKYKDGYLPLMLSDKIICIKPFDASTSMNSTSNSHSRSSVRDESGSNYWKDSNMRSWLNSSESSGDVTWLCGNPPDETHVFEGYDDYADEAGFLTNFTHGELATMKEATIKSLVACPEYENGIYTMGSEPYTGNNYDTAYAEYTTDKVFLLDENQVNTIYNNRETLNDCYIANPTSKAVDNSEYKESGFLQAEDLMVSKKWYYWLRSPAIDSFALVSYINTAGDVDSHAEACESGKGVRPSFYFNPGLMQYLDGVGTYSKPYSIDSGYEFFSYKFVDEDGTVLKEETAEAGSTIEPPEENPTKKDGGIYKYYSFKGWKNYEDGMTLTKDITFIAEYYKIIIYDAGIKGDNNVTVGESYSCEFEFILEKPAYTAAIEIQYPSYMELQEVSPMDFKYATLNNTKTENGITTATIVCQYDNAASAEEDTAYTPFMMVFQILSCNASETARVEIKSVTLYDSDSNVYTLSNFGSKDIVINPKLVDSISIDGDDTVYDTAQYSAVILPLDASNPTVEWSIDDESIATISSSGVLKALKNGTVEITATTTDGSGVSASKEVIVYAYAKINSLTLDTGIWNEEFDSYTYNYKIYVPKNTKSIKINASFTEGILKLNDTNLMINNISSTITLESDETTFTLNRSGVSDMSDGVYTITVTAMETKKVEPIDNYTNKVLIEKSVVDNNVILCLTSLDGSDLSEFQLFAAEYTDEGILRSIRTGINTISNDTVFIIGELPNSPNHKIMLWDKNQTPVIDVMRDYSYYIGAWETDLTFAKLEINSATDNTMGVYFQYGEFAVTIPDARIDGDKVYGEYYQVLDDGGINWDNYIMKGTITLNLENDSILLDWSGTENGTEFSHCFTFTKMV